MMGPTPWYYIVLGWAKEIVTLLYPIFLVVILFLAYKEFKRLVNHIAPKPMPKEEIKKED
ncbi:MAG TPA: hypothetical protein ENN38_04265 [Actinobacteria bacterium]|nr:hypothetical protein [Actinomycetota bacterium]